MPLVLFWMSRASIAEIVSLQVCFINKLFLMNSSWTKTTFRKDKYLPKVIGHFTFNNLQLSSKILLIQKYSTEPIKYILKSQ